ncbi:MAG: hydrogenase maturation nickel metallochaperone HypA [Gemmatimonadota bacterium]
MHELSIAMSLVEIATEEASRLGDVRIDAVHVRLGPLSGVVEESLRFSFGLVSQGTAIDGSRLEIEHVPLTVYCMQCATTRHPRSIQHLRCPVCDAPTADIVRGKDLELFALEVHDDVATHS